MTPSQHFIVAWARKMRINELEKFIADHPQPTTGSITITVFDKMSTHLISDLLREVIMCRDEYRKDLRMTTDPEKRTD